MLDELDELDEPDEPEELDELELSDVDVDEDSVLPDFPLELDEVLDVLPDSRLSVR